MKNQMFIKKAFRMAIGLWLLTEALLPFLRTGMAVLPTP
jgi:hypothetical protein